MYIHRFQAGFLNPSRDLVGQNTVNEIQADVVAYDGFFNKSRYDEKQSYGKHLTSDAELSANLRDKITGTDDRTSHQLWEETHIKSIVEQRFQRFYVATKTSMI